MPFFVCRFREVGNRDPFCPTLHTVSPYPNLAAPSSSAAPGRFEPTERGCHHPLRLEGVSHGVERISHVRRGRRTELKVRRRTDSASGRGLSEAVESEVRSCQPDLTRIVMARSSGERLRPDDFHLLRSCENSLGVRGECLKMGLDETGANGLGE